MVPALVFTVAGVLIGLMHGAPAAGVITGGSTRRYLVDANAVRA